MVTQVIVPEDGSPITEIALQAVYSGRTQMIPWKNLEDATQWIVGWK